MSETFQTGMMQPAPGTNVAPAPELPDADEFFGNPAQPTGTAPKAPELPTADDFFSPQQSLPNRVAAGVHDYIMRGLALPRIFTQPMEGPVADQLLERATTGRILDAFGQGAKQGWGEGELGLSEESQKWLREAGIFNDYAKGRSSVVKAFNEALIRPSALLLDTGLRSINAAIGAVSGLTGQTVTEAGGQGKALERDLNLMMSETFAGMPFALRNPKLPVDIPKARELGVIGEGEGAWKGTVDRKPVPESVLADTVKAQDEAEVAGGRPTGTPEDMALQPGESMPAEPPPPDIHQTARMVAPEVFRQYDELQGRAETFRRWIGELDETRKAETAKPFNERITELQSQLEGASARNARRYQAEIDEQTAKRDEALAAIKGDTPDMARIRQELLKADFEMRDLAPEVSRAYREAGEAMPRVKEPAPAAVPEAVRAAEEAAPIAPETQPEAPVAVPEAITAPETAPARQTELPLGPAVDIAGDVVRKLEALGREPELARAEAAIVASHYEARAQRLGTTAGELYRAEGLDVRAGRERAPKREMELAQKDKDGITYNQDGRAETDTDAFRNWFGDSKVVSDAGEPLRVYHGTARDFESFDAKELGETTGANSAKLGFFFTNDARTAVSYAHHGATDAQVLKLIKEAEKAEKRGDWDTYDAKIVEAEQLEASLVEPENRMRGQNVLPVYLAIKKPLVIDAKGKNFAEAEVGITDKIKQAKKEGYDGVIIRNLDDAAGLTDVVADHYVVFSPEQIKSVFNRGTFDPNDPRILYQSEPSLTPAIRHGGKVYRGATHIEALKKIADPTERQRAELDGDNRVYITERGKVLDRFKAADYARNFDLLDPSAPSWASTAPELISEHLRKPEQGKEAPSIDLSPGGGSKTVKIGDTSIDYGVSRDGQTAEVILVKTPEAKRGEGSARAAMEQFLRETDAQGLTVFLTPEPMAKGVFKGKLEEFYRSLGFRPNTGKRKDFRAMAAMVREPAARDLAQSAKGKIRLMDDGRSIITLFKSADASTFMHETGHLWLDELMRDAKLEQAVQSLRDDAVAVRKWLGASEDGPITRAQHEKFARGFERYLMEGRAPNEKLAGVFEQFRRWLTDIYQTVARLRSPITDEIRSVFDRLIAPEREGPPVITETEPSVARFAEKHEIRAREAKPESAAAEADAIALEAQDIIRTLPEEIQDAINRGTPEEGRIAPAAEAGRGESPRAEPADTGVTGERPAPDGTVEGPGAQQPGGGGVAAPGAGTRVLERPRAAEAQPVGPHDPIPPSETRLLDKAGNIRIDNLNVPEDVAQAIRQAADEGEGFMGARRGVVSDAQVLDLADALGMDAAMLSTRKLGEAFNAEQIMAARKLLVQSATEVRNLMAKAGDPLASDADVVAYGAAKARHMMIQEQVAGLTAEAGRALRAFRAIEGMADAEGLGAFLKENAGTTLYQLRREATLGRELDTPQKVSKFINDSKRATFSDMILEFWINGLLSGPITQVKNIAGNTVVALNRVAETGLAAASGEVRQALGIGARERVLPGEVAATMYGALRGAQDGIVAAWHAFKTEEIQYGAGTMDQRKFQAIPSARVTIAGQELELGGKQVRIPGRLLQATDEFFKAVAHRQELQAIAYREASQAGLTGDAFLERIARVVQNPTDEQMLAARRAAEYQTFTRALGPTGRAIQNFANSYPLLKVVLPFIRTPTNIIKYAAERSPLGLLSREIRDNLAGRNGGVAQDTQIARLAMGSMLSTAAVGLALEGLLTGSGPSDVGERAALRATGWQPNSVRIGDTWYSYEWLDPFSTILGIASGITEAAEKLPQAMEDEELSKVAAMGFGSVAKDIMGKLSLRGASDLIKAVTDPDRYGAKYIQNLTGTLVPTSLAQIARTQDPIQRESRSMLDSVKMRLPGLRETLFPKRDVFGEPIVSEGAAGPDAFSPLYQSTVKNDPVVKWLSAIEAFPAKADRQIRGVELTDQQYDDYARISGRLMKSRLDAIVNQPGIQQAPLFVQREVAKNAIEESREAARSMIMMQYPIIMQTAVNDKIRILQGGEPKKGALKQPE